MSTVLIIDPANPSAVSVRRRTVRSRLAARVRSLELDERLADGASPDSSVALSLRAGMLYSAAGRRRLAHRYRRLLELSARSSGPLAARVPLARTEIRDSSELIEELADRLESAGPVDARGIARAHLLLSEGVSPLYRPRVSGALEPALRDAINALEQGSHGT